jgi:hypothetical protein
LRELLEKGQFKEEHMVDIAATHLSGYALIWWEDHKPSVPRHKYIDFDFFLKKLTHWALAMEKHQERRDGRSIEEIYYEMITSRR